MKQTQHNNQIITTVSRIVHPEFGININAKSFLTMQNMKIERA